jgi:hypothetical protein
VTPVFLVVFGTSLNASQSVCEMAGIEFLVFKCTYPIACPECQQIRAWVKSLRDDRSFRQSFISLQLTYKSLSCCCTKSWSALQQPHWPASWHLHLAPPLWQSNPLTPSSKRHYQTSSISPLQQLLIALTVRVC